MSDIWRCLKAVASPWHFSILAAWLIAALPTTAFAQNACDGILVGLVDFRTTTSEEQFAESILQWIASTKSQTETSTKTQSANAGFSIPGYLDDFTGAWNRGDYQGKTYSEALHTHFSKDTTSRKKFFDSFKQANPNVTNAWLDCTKEANAIRRLRCWAEPKFSDESTVTIHYELRSEFDQPQQVTVTDVTISSNLTPSGSGLLGRTIVSSTNGDDAIFLRSSRASGTVQIRTSHPSFNCTAKFPALPEIPPCCSPPPAIAPCIEVNAQGECTKCRITYPNNTLMPQLLVGVTPPPQFCTNMKDGDYRAIFSGTLRGAGLMTHAFPRVLVNNDTKSTGNFVELGARLEPPHQPPSQTVPIGASENIRLRPVDKKLSVILHINGPTHCRFNDTHVPCYLDNGAVLFEPY